MNLLIIDDNDDVAYLYSKLAKPYFTNIFTCDTCAKAEKTLKLHEMDAIICDLNLGCVLGSDLLISLRHLIVNAKVYFISCSEHLQTHSDHAKSFGLNVVGCDQKPVDIKQLVSIFKSCAST